MKWINPREQLPKNEQLIWILFIENRQGERCGDPCAEITLAKANLDSYGVMRAEEITPKGYPQYSKHFYEWWHYPQDDKEEHEPQYRTFSDKDLITAWLPYEGNELPDWDYIGLEESREIILKNPKYKLGIKKEKIQIKNDHFIYMSDHKPDIDGTYVVVNKDGIWLLRYEAKTCDPWIAPNGKPVIAWYPVPGHY